MELSLTKKIIFTTYIWRKKAVVLKNNIKKYGLLFLYNIRADTLLGIGYVDSRWVPYLYSKWLSKRDSPCNISQVNYNKYQYKVENQNCIYWPILGSYNNWQIIHCMSSRKQH